MYYCKQEYPSDFSGKEAPADFGFSISVKIFTIDNNNNQRLTYQKIGDALNTSYTYTPSGAYTIFTVKTV